MKIIKLQGGLGNQLFQCAYGLAYEQRNDETVMFDFSWYYNSDKSFGGLVSNRKFMLDRFNTNIKIATEDLVKSIKQNKLNIIVENGPEYDSNLLQISGNKYIKGFFQNEQYFKDYKQLIVNNFKLFSSLNTKNARMLEYIQNTNSISIHIRRGDYLNLSNIYAQCTLSYYMDAIKYCINVFKDVHFYVFSDDMEWVKSSLQINVPVSYIDFNSQDECYFDLWLMKNCKHNIVANSSFSWWSAWLNENPTKLVIAPKKWYVQNSVNVCSTDWLWMDN